VHPVHTLQQVEGVEESALPDDDAARLPGASAPAPWDTLLDAVVWFHRAAPGAADRLPEALRGRKALPVTVGALIRYRETPVGPYREVLASPALLLGPRGPEAAIPFIAVDSLSSVHAGRENWALPKTLARFEWPEPPHKGFEVDAEGRGWSVHATVRPRRRRLPFAATSRNRQVTPAGQEITFDSRWRGRARLASVELETRGPTLPGWLRSGRHPALVLDGARVRVDPARPG
jgi:Acetoacetate decarboxylase (ADC)